MTVQIDIDPLTAVIEAMRLYDRIRLFDGVQELTGDRVASQTMFQQTSTTNAPGPPPGKVWKTPAQAIRVNYETGGPLDLDSPHQTPRLDCWCYGEDEPRAGLVYLRVQEFCRNTARVVVPTRFGNAFIYWVHVDGTPQTQFDVQVQVPYIQVYLAARVAEGAVP